jgi:hypothetical protein
VDSNLPRFILQKEKTQNIKKEKTPIKVQHADGFEEGD